MPVTTLAIPIAKETTVPGPAVFLLLGTGTTLALSSWRPIVALINLSGQYEFEAATGIVAALTVLDVGLAPPEISAEFGSRRRTA